MANLQGHIEGQNEVTANYNRLRRAAVEKRIGASLPDPNAITGQTFTAVSTMDGKWLPAKIDIGTGETVALLYPFRERDDAISYAMTNFAVGADLSNATVHFHEIDLSDGLDATVKDMLAKVRAAVEADQATDPARRKGGIYDAHLARNAKKIIERYRRNKGMASNNDTIEDILECMMHHCASGAVGSGFDAYLDAARTNFAQYQENIPDYPE